MDKEKKRRERSKMIDKVEEIIVKEWEGIKTGENSEAFKIFLFIIFLKFLHFIILIFICLKLFWRFI